MSGVVVEGKTVEEAIDQACSELQVPRERVRYVVLENPKKGFMGLFGAKRAKVKVEPVSIQEEVGAFLEQTTDKMGLQLTLTVEKPRKGEIVVEFAGADIALLIGKNGQTLESLQYLVNRIFCTQLRQQKTRVWLDANGYRKRKEKFLQGLAQRTGELVRRTKKKIALDPMPASERKLIHSVLQGKANLRTESKGVEPDRYVVIYWKE